MNILKATIMTLVVLTAGVSAFAQEALLWQTGQQTSYATGDDAELARGVAWPEPRFTDNGDGTVTDGLTGLMWLKDFDCFGTLSSSSALNTVTDFNISAADFSCSGLTASYTDWRLPNRKEMRSLVDYEQLKPPLPLGHPFANVQTDIGLPVFYWTSTTNSANTYFAWVLDMDYGDLDSLSKSGSAYMTVVRTPSDPSPDPVPDIKANAGDGPLTLARGAALALTVTLDAGTRSGENADWWVVASTPGGVYYYNPVNDWRPGLVPTRQGALFDISSPYQVMNRSNLPAGPYTFYFGVDMNMNGRLDTGELFSDSVKVTIGQ